MRLKHILVAFIAILAASACSFTELDDVQDSTPESSQYLQIVGRIAQYSDINVATRSKKEGDESKVTSMGLALFPIENGTIGNCLYYDFQLGGSIVFIVDRKDAVFNNYVDKPFAMYIFANMQDADGFPLTPEDGVSKPLDYFIGCAASANKNVKEVPANGFPMVGSLGNTVSINDKDGIELILKPEQTDANIDGLPLVDRAPTDNLEIPLKSLYAKFSFTISVKPDQEIVGNKAPRFDLLKYEVHNIAKTVDSNSSTNSDTDVTETSDKVTMDNYAQGATKATFDFYLPERYLYPLKSIDEALPNELKNASIEEKEKYRQRYKNLLPGENQKATYVTITGKYTDHQENAYDVSYNIYLGGNNYDNFDVIRNTHYDNSVTIRGISASDDQSVNPDGISIDWRVNVERSTPLVINLRRESLLDAHFEVRPLRLRLVGDNIPTGTSATVQILKEDGTDTDIPGWVRMEESGSTEDHITAVGVSQGKRKYFTTNLVTETLANGKIIEVKNLNGSNKTVWIYVDENPTGVSRAALLRVTYDGVDKDFKIVQNGLYKVTGADSGRDYYIEQYEEYLYNYDAEDSYGQTKDEGMPWGPDGRLSYIHDSFTCNETNSDWKNYIKANPIKYDFYIGKHDDDNENSDLYTKDGGTLHNFAGQEFTKEIAENSNAAVEYLTLGEQADGAVEYCYNRNKRNSDGTVDVKWYLPSADELEDFIVAAYSDFKEFQDNYYWTSQPAYIRNAFYYEYYDGSKSNSNREDTYVFTTYEDNPEYARATKVVYANGKYDYVKSGLNKTPAEPHDMDAGCKDKNEIVYNDTYFNVMYGWYRYTTWSLFQGTQTKTEEKTMTVDEHFDEYRDGNKTNKRYHIHLGHLYDMIQTTAKEEHGYHLRTKNNRVRCAYKSN